MNKNIISRKTCTAQLQSFNKAARYTGSPQKASQIKITNKERAIDFENFDPRPEKFRHDEQYLASFYNVWVSFAADSLSQNPILQTFEPANIRALYDDHDYFSLHYEDHFLQLIKVTKGSWHCSENS